MDTWYETTKDELQDSFATRADTVLRADADHLVTASEVELVVGRGEPPTIRLRTGILPAQLMALRERLGWTTMDLTKYRPLVPVTLTWRPGAALQEAYDRSREAGWSLEECVESKGPNGFPAFYDLELYDLEHVGQRSA